MYEVPTDRVVLVPRRRREATRGFVEREREKIRPGLFGPIDPGLPWGNPCHGANSEGGQDFDTRVSGVNAQGYVRVAGERHRYMIDPIGEQCQEF